MRLNSITFLALWTALILAISPMYAEDSWPGEPEEGLLWVWGSAIDAQQIFDADGQWLRDSEFRLRALARPDPHFAALVKGGAVEAIDMAAVLAAQWQAEQRLYIEMALRPEPGVSDGALWVLAGEDGPLWSLVLRDGRLLVEVPGSIPNDLGPPLAMQDAQHLSFEIAGTQLRWWLNGAMRQTQELADVPPLSETQRISFGGQVDGSDSWAGSLEGLLLAAAKRQPHVSAAYWQAQWAERQPIETSRVRARLQAHAREPAASDLLEYDECLLAMVWKIEEQISGPEITAAEILTWHWYQLDRRVLERARPPAVGTEWILDLSVLADNPQTSGVQQVDTDLEPDQVYGLDAFMLQREPQAP